MGSPGCARTCSATTGSCARPTSAVFVTGERRGRRAGASCPSWPPPGTARAAAVARADDGERSARIGRAGAAERGGDRYRYDPADPTPSVGGPVLLSREPVVDNRALEARADVLTYTTDAACRGARGDRAGRVSSCAFARARRTSTCSRACATSMPTAPRGTSATRSTRVAPGPLRAARRRRLARRLRAVADRAPVRGRATASACRSPRARTRATPATRAPARTRTPRPGWTRSSSRCSATRSTRQP